MTKPMLSVALCQTRHDVFFPPHFPYVFHLQAPLTNSLCKLPFDLHDYLGGEGEGEGGGIVSS